MTRQELFLKITPYKDIVEYDEAGVIKNLFPCDLERSRLDKCKHSIDPTCCECRRNFWNEETNFNI